VLIQRHARRITNLLKRAVAFVDVKLVRRRIVYHDQIEQLVVVYVNKRRAETIKLLLVAHARLHAHVFKRAVRLLVIERVAFTREPAWTTHHRRAAKLASGAA